MPFRFRLIPLALALAASVEAQNSAPPRLTVADMREDLAALRTDFLGRDNSFSLSARTRADEELEKLEQKLDGLSLAQFELALSRIAALADNGHTLAAPLIRARHFNHVPIRLSPFGTEFRVLRATTANSDLLGARLVAIDGHPVAQLIDSARTLAGGTPARRDRFANVLFESPEQLNALGLATAPGGATYSFVSSAGGKRIERHLTGEPYNTRESVASQRWLSPELLPDEQGTWRTALDPAKAPWSLAEPSVRFRWRAAPELSAIVIELRQVVSSPGNSITDFLRETSEKLQAQRPQNLVLDMRLNGGGNLQTARDFMKSLPILVPGRIFVLTSPWTFSAAISSIGYLEQAAPDRVTIVGEEVGDRLEFWAEGRGATLPHSGMVMLFSTERHDYRNGCRAYSDCHNAVVRYPIAVNSLAPDIAAPWTFEAYRAGRDPGMEAVAKALGGGR